MMPGDRLVCAFVQPLGKGEQFKGWPLHVTVVPWFRTEISSSDLADELQAALRGVGSFEVVMNGEARFGRNKLVNLVQQPTPLMEIEHRVRQILKSHNTWIVDETTKRKRSFRPHVTEQKTGRLQEGDRFMCEGLFIVEQLGSSKQVASIIDFGLLD